MASFSFISVFWSKQSILYNKFISKKKCLFSIQQDSTPWIPDYESPPIRRSILQTFCHSKCKRRLMLTNHFYNYIPTFWDMWTDDRSKLLYTVLAKAAVYLVAKVICLNEDANHFGLIKSSFWAWFFRSDRFLASTFLTCLV